MADFDVISYASSKKYTDETVEGGGAIKGKNCVIDSIDDITGGHKVNFKWTLDDGTELEGSMEVMNGQDGVDGQDGAPGKDGDPGLGIKSVAINSNNHLIVTYDDDTTQDAGEIPGASGTGDYEELDNLPSIAGVQLIGNITLAQLGIDIPTSTSDLTNDSGFITNAVNDLVNYYKKSETYTKEEVQQLIQAIPQMHIAIVQQLPTEDISTSTIYFVPKQTPDTNDVYDEYMYISNAWEHIGSTAIDLSNYYTKTQVDTLLAAKANATDVYTKSQVDTAISEVEDTVDSLSTAQSKLAEDVETLDSEVVALAEKVNSPKEHTGTYLAEAGTKEGSALAKRIYGMSVQDGTPTPDSPVEIQSAKADFRCTGKNLIPYPYHSNQSLDAGYVSAGVTVKADSVNKNRISFAGTSTGRVNAYIIYPYYDNYLASGNYKIKVKHISGTNRTVNVALEKGRKGSTTYVSTKARASLDSSTSESTATCIITSDEVKDYSFALALYGMNNQTYDDVYEVELTLADVDQTYEPYQHTDVTTDITLRSIEVASTDDYTYERDGKYYIADTIDWSEDEGYEITRRIKVEDLGDKTYSYAPSDGYFYTTFNGILSRNYLDKVAICDGFAYYSLPMVNIPSGGFRLRESGSNILNFRYTLTRDINEFKALVAGMKVYYILATPTTEPITSEQAQALLSLKTYDEASYISSTGSVEPSVDLEYAKSEMGAKALTGHNEAYIAQELEGVYGVKNFLDLSLRRNDLPAGITTTFTEDGGIHISGQRTDSGTSDWGLNYTIKGLKKGIAYKFTCNQYDVPRVGMYYVSSNITKPTTFTWTQDGDGTFNIYIAKGVTYDVTIYPMLRLASIQSDEYQPYAKSNRELTDDVEELSTNATKVVTLPASISIFDVLTDETTYPIKNTYWKRAQDITNGSDTLSTLLGVRNDAILRIDKYSKYYIGIEINDSSSGLLLTAWANNSISTLKFVKIDTSTSPYVSQVTVNKATT